jgi:hypothetical protein
MTGTELLAGAGAALSSAWSEAANRRLRSLMWNGHPVGEIAFLLDRKRSVVQAQLRALGLRR